MGTVEYLNPEGLHKNPAFTQAIATTGPVKTVYVGGQNAVTAEGAIVGVGDLAAQTAQAIDNIKTALAAAGATLDHVVKCTIYVVDGQELEAGFQAYMQTWGMPEHPPTISVIMVARLSHPDWLVEIDAIAVVPLGE